MPAKSKIRSPSTKPGRAVKEQDERTDFYCCRCKKHYTRQKGNFPASQSPIYEGNGRYLTICNHCIDDLYEHYKSVLGNDAEALRRMCLKFDIYWNPEIYSTLSMANTSNSRIRGYISRTNLYKYVGKTFDDTLDEEYQAAEAERIESERQAGIINSVDDISEADGDIRLSEDVVKYWGTGFSPEMYGQLEDRRQYWMSQFPDGTELDPGEEALLRQICNLEISINRDLAAGNSIEKGTNALNTLLGSMNIKPSQKKEAEDNYVPFGCEIAKFEEEDPIVEPDEEFEDVDGIRKNVISWFLGSLCKTAGVKNEYSQYFEDEIKKYTVERPKFEGEEDGEEYENDDADGDTNG